MCLPRWSNRGNGIPAQSIHQRLLLPQLQMQREVISSDANIAATFTEPLLRMKCGNEGSATWEQGKLVNNSNRF
jgi:hypothetical protein